MSHNYVTSRCVLDNSLETNGFLIQEGNRVISICDSKAIYVELNGFSSCPDHSRSHQRELIDAPIVDLSVGIYDPYEDKGAIFTVVIRKLIIYGLLLMIISIKSDFDTGWKGILACYICGTERGHSSPLLLPVQFRLLSVLSTISRDRGECAMAGHGGSVSNVLGKTPASREGSRVMTDAPAAESSLH